MGLIVTVVIVALIVGILFARKNPAIASKVDAAANATKTAAEAQAKKL